MIAVKGEAYSNSAPLWKYLAISFSNVYASTCQYEALKYVSFPVQMLGKSFKMMPVMIWGMAVSGKRFGVKDWMTAFAITGGVVEFLMTGPISSHSDAGNSSYGLALLGGFLALDGFTSTFQEKLFKEHTTSKYNQMLYINLGSCVISSFTLVASGRLSEAVSFTVAHPLFLQDAMSLSASAVAGQWFIYSQVKEFGALVFAATMNVRQVVSILISYAKYGHSITMLQIVGLMIIFGALFYKSLAGLVASPDEKKPLLEKKNAAAEPASSSGIAKV
jgi:adenosine 3'-phospho 5'-phosphosulfate transporter B2